MIYQNSGITFNNVKEHGTEVSFGPVAIEGTTGPDELGGIINVVDIDWNGAKVENALSINTTGELLSWIKAQNGLNIKTLQSKNNSNVLTQDDFNDANTIYNIAYDFVLGSNITMKANCMLNFNGGSISNTGSNTFKLSGNNTQIKADKKAIFTKMYIDGTWDVPNIYSAWFSDITSENMLRQLINLTSDNYNNIYIDKGNYLIAADNLVVNNKNCGLVFEHSNTYIHNNGTLILMPNDYEDYYGIWFKGNNITWDGGEFKGDALDHNYENSAVSHGIKVLCTDASNTPKGKTLYVGDTTIKGTLAPSANLVGNCYWVRCNNDANALIKYNYYIVKHKDSSDPNSEYVFDNTNTHEWGRGIIAHGENIIIQNVKSSLCTGDAFNVKANNTILRNIKGEKCRRQGITGSGLSNIIIENFKINDIGTFTVDNITITGTNPQAGIDIEPNRNNDGTENIIIKNGIIQNCKKGIDVYKSGMNTDDENNNMESYNQNVVIQNVNILNVSHGIVFARLERGLIQNVKIEFSEKALSFTNYTVKSSYVKVENVDCIGTDNKIEDSDDYIPSLGIRYYYTDVIVENSRFTCNCFAKGDRAAYKYPSILTCKNCTIIQDHPIEMGIIYFDKCFIANSIELGFEHSRPLTADGDKAYLYLTDCVIQQEKSEQLYAVYCTGTNSEIRLENCKIIDYAKKTLCRCRIGNKLTLIDVIKEDEDEDTFRDTTDGYALEKYVRLYQLGTTEERPIKLSMFAKGHNYFDTTIDKPIIWNGYYWIDYANNRITWPIKYSLTNISISNKQQPDANISYVATLIPDEGYSLPTSITIKIDTTTLISDTDYTYDQLTGEIVVLGINGTGGITGELKIGATGVSQ